MSHSPVPATDDENEAEIRLEIAADTNRIANEVATVVNEEVTSDSTDATRRRFKTLGGVIKSMLFEKHDQVINEREVSNVLPHSEQKELQVCVRIINFLKPYIPEKSNYYTMSYQLPFFLMANDVLHATGYSKFTSKISPYLTPSNLNAFKIDAPSLFSFFCSKTKERDMNVYDFNGDVIVSIQEATESKDAIFCSFFDLITIRSICSNYGLGFAHNMLMLPGLKYVRLTGTLKKLVPAEICRVTSSPATSTQRATAQATRHLKNEIKGHQDKSHSLQAELRELLKERKAYIL